MSDTERGASLDNRIWPLEVLDPALQGSEIPPDLGSQDFSPTTAKGIKEKYPSPDSRKEVRG